MTESCSWRGVLDTVLCDQVCKWIATGLWFSLCTLISFTNNFPPRYDWNRQWSHFAGMFITWYFRDRPFNLQEGLWFFVSFRKKFPDNTRVGIFIFLSRKARNLFYYSTLGYMTKTLNQIIFFFSSTKISIYFSATLGIRIFF